MTKIRTDFKLVNQFGQIGIKAETKPLQQKLVNFLCSTTGMKFVRDSIEKVSDKDWTNINSIKAEIFQQGLFQFVIKFSVENSLTQKGEFCFILSKGLYQLNTDQVTIDEYYNLGHYNSLHPKYFVEPLILVRQQAGGMVFYSSRLYENQLELDFKTDGLIGRKGLYINNSITPRALNYKEQEALLTEMVKIVALAYDEKSGKSIFGLKLSAGDFIVDFKNKDNFDLRLITIRLTENFNIPTFISSLLHLSIGCSITPGSTAGSLRVLPFNQNIVYQGLIKSFIEKENLSQSRAQIKANLWMSYYHQALARKELNSFIDMLNEAAQKLGQGNFRCLTLEELWK